VRDLVIVCLLPERTNAVKTKTKITSLYPIPGSKRGAKYAMLKPLLSQSQICEPFAGGAAKSLQLGLRSNLGEINISQAALAQVPTSKKTITNYIKDYEGIRSCFLEGIDLDALLRYADADVKQQQKALKEDCPKVVELLTQRWKSITLNLFESINSGDPSSGIYSFCQRACFGNVMRLSPSASGFNVSWHVSKLKNAIAFSPHDWCEGLKAQHWNPQVLTSWERAINSVINPQKCYLLLDPPYVEAEGDKKMTPCYLGHKVTGDGRAQTYALSIEPLREGLRRGFPWIQLTNYYSPQLDNEVTQLAIDNGYLCNRTMLGKCGALGNSNGRFKHGGRVDQRPEPIECAWSFQPWQQIELFTFTA